jgi:thioredoxin 1
MSDVVHVDDSNFDAEVLQSETPVLVDFSATWCGPCQRQYPLVEKFAKDNAGIKVCKVDIDDAPEVAAKLRIRGVPTLMLFDAGSAVGTKVGLTSLADINNFVGDKLNKVG